MHASKPYDILAVKGKKKWVIDVKTGKKTGINLERFRELLDKKEVNLLQRRN
jgi:Holliday junction resolvase